MLKLYHTPGTRGFRVIWTCAELNHRYEIEWVNFSKEYRSSPEWRNINPVGKVPAMVDNGLKMFESGAMVQYILDRYGNGHLQPKPGTQEHALYLQWSWFAESTFARPLGEIVNHRRMFGDGSVPEAIEEMKDRCRLCVDALDKELAGKPYLVGAEFTAADVMMGYSIRGYRRLVTEILPDHAQAYWNRLTARPAYRAADAADQSAS